MTEPQMGGTYDQLLDAAIWAERIGIPTFARSDHYYTGQEPKPDATDAFATLAGMARETSTVRLAVLVAPITFRHPAVIAKNAATIDQMSHGRFDLGVGTGWMDLEHDVYGLPFPDLGERFARFEESLNYLDAAFTGGSFEGDFYSITADSNPKPENIRILIGGTGPKRTPTLAGKYADEYNHAARDPEEHAPKIQLMKEAATAAGRDPESVTVSVMGALVTSKDESKWRSRLDWIANLWGTDSETLSERWASLPIGNPEHAKERLAAFEEVGVTKYYGWHLNIEDRGEMEETYEALLT